MYELRKDKTISSNNVWLSFPLVCCQTIVHSSGSRLVGACGLTLEYATEKKRKLFEGYN